MNWINVNSSIQVRRFSEIYYDTNAVIRTDTIILYLLLSRNRNQWNHRPYTIILIQFGFRNENIYETMSHDNITWHAFNPLWIGFHLAAANHKTIWCANILSFFSLVWQSFFFVHGKDLMMRRMQSAIFSRSHSDVRCAQLRVHNDVWEQKAMDTNNKNKIISENNVELMARDALD